MFRSTEIILTQREGGKSKIKDRGTRKVWGETHVGKTKNKQIRMPKETKTGIVT